MSSANCISATLLAQLNPQEHVWDELREKLFHNRAFDSLDALEKHLEGALRRLELDPKRMHSIAGWEWIINSVFNCKLNNARPTGC